MRVADGAVVIATGGALAERVGGTVSFTERLLSVCSTSGTVRGPEQ